MKFSTMYWGKKKEFCIYRGLSENYQNVSFLHIKGMTLRSSKVFYISEGQKKAVSDMLFD